MPWKSAGVGVMGSEIVVVGLSGGVVAAVVGVGVVALLLSSRLIRLMVSYIHMGEGVISK